MKVQEEAEGKREREGLVKWTVGELSELNFHYLDKKTL